MLDTVGALPAGFWIVIAELGLGIYLGLVRLREGIGVPLIAILVTIMTWYIGDVIYNDYVNTHMLLFTEDILERAWWEVALFIFTVILGSLHLSGVFNYKLIQDVGPVSVDAFDWESDKNQQSFATICVWNCVASIALIIGARIHFQDQFVYYLFPYLGDHPGPWVTTGIGGAGDSLLALANYVQLLVGAIFGLIAALSTKPAIRAIAMVGCALTWPYYIFDRTRKFILVLCVPGIFAWVVLRLKGSLLKKALVLGCLFLLVNAWFGFIEENRANGRVIAAFSSGAFDFAGNSGTRHQGLNMFEELCWINKLIDEGSFEISWGGNYFANVVNPIPRSIWSDKPTIGLDYAIARGQGGAASAAGVYSTLSQGLIGQGVSNFGYILGPIVSGLIMSTWACLLSRLLLNLRNPGAFPLFCLGLIMTFNIGRDITLLELYPFVFGYIGYRVLNRRSTLQPGRIKAL